MEPSARTKRPLRVLLVVLSVVISGLVIAGPAARVAAAFPAYPCTSTNLHQSYVEYMNSRGDYLVWVCEYGSIFKYWWKLDGVGT